MPSKVTKPRDENEQLAHPWHQMPTAELWYQLFIHHLHFTYSNQRKQIIDPIYLNIKRGKNWPEWRRKLRYQTDDA